MLCSLVLASIYFISSTLDVSQCISLRCGGPVETNCSTRQLNSFEYEFSVESSNGSAELESNFTTPSIELDINGHVVSNDTMYNGHIIRGVCDGADKVDLKLFEENSSTCDVKLNLERNQIVLSNCDERPLIMSALVDSGLIIRNCSECVDIYVIDYTNCTSYCEMERRNSTTTDERTDDTDYITKLWEMCPRTIFNETLAVPGMECDRRACVNFLEEACSCCSINCPDHLYHSENASDLCPSQLITNCNTPEGVDYCQTSFCNSKCLDCGGSDEPYCQQICEDPFQNIFLSDIRENLCKDEVEVLEVEGFCADQIRSNCSNLILSDINCQNSSEKCASVCQREEVVRFFAMGCPSEVYQFCRIYTAGLLTTVPVLTDDIFSFYLNVIEPFIEDVSPTFLESDLLYLLSFAFMTDLLLNDSNIKLLVGAYDGLLDDGIYSNWINDSNRVNTTECPYCSAESSFLRQVEFLALTVSESLLLGSRNNSFSFLGNNLFFALMPTHRAEINDSQYSISVAGVNNQTAEVKISENVLCEEWEKESAVASCSSVVAVAVANNLANYLHVDLSRRFHIDLSQTHPIAELLSIQVVSFQNWMSRIIENPVEITFRLPILKEIDQTQMKTVCVFWNDTESSWSSEGVETVLLTEDTVKCTSNHLTSFTVLASPRDPDTSGSLTGEDLAFEIVTYLGQSLSIVCLLATIFCLLFFLGKQVFQRVHFFVHLNLAFALFLAYFMYTAFLYTAAGNKRACMFVAVSIHYFFLSSFSWMLCEGIMLYLMLVVVFSKLSKKWWFFMIIGYGLPAIPVIVTFSVHPSEYGTDSFCWISSDDVIYGFIAPTVAILTVNTIFLVIALVKVLKVTREAIKHVRESKGKGKKKDSNFKDTKKLFIKLFVATIVLAPLLGVTWILGLFIRFDNTTTLAWIFTILNSFQGLFIFFFHVVRSEQLWKTPRALAIRAFICKCVPKKSPKRRAFQRNTTIRVNISDLDSEGRPKSNRRGRNTQSDDTSDINSSLASSPERNGQLVQALDIEDAGFVEDETKTNSDYINASVVISSVSVTVT